MFNIKVLYNMLEIYTDGSLRRPNIGAYGFVIVDTKKDHVVYKHVKTQLNTTNNIMELKAIEDALLYLKKPTQCIVYSDSQYSVFALTRWIYGWIKYNWTTMSGQPVKNKELLLSIHTLMKYHDVKLLWVKAHNGDKYNEMVDELVQAATRKLQQENSLTVVDMIDGKKHTVKTAQPLPEIKYPIPSDFGAHIAQDDTPQIISKFGKPR